MNIRYFLIRITGAIWLEISVFIVDEVDCIVTWPSKCMAKCTLYNSRFRDAMLAFVPPTYVQRSDTNLKRDTNSSGWTQYKGIFFPQRNERRHHHGRYHKYHAIHTLRGPWGEYGVDGMLSTGSIYNTGRDDTTKPIINHQARWSLCAGSCKQIFLIMMCWLFLTTSCHQAVILYNILLNTRLSNFTFETSFLQ